MDIEAAPLLRDEALDAQALHLWDGGRLRPVIDALEIHIGHAVRHRPSTRDAPRRVGLFGGLGQGKSTATRVAIEELDAKATPLLRAKCQLLGHDIARFDISHFKADDLQWRFLSSVIGARLWRNALLLGLVVAVLAGIAFVYGLVTANWTRCELWNQPVDIASCWFRGLSTTAFHTILLPALVPLVPLVARAAKGIRSLAALNPSTAQQYTRRELNLQRWASSFLALPRLVVVDDLDRASIDQQRAFLRALLRYSNLMKFGVLVCMDDSELLASAPDPESPQELLRKTIEVELRIPDRGAEDLALLAVLALREAARLQPQRSKLLLQPQIVADFARVLVLWPEPVSPRLAKRLLNDTLWAAEQRGAWAVDELGAMLRLVSLQALLPALRRHHDGLREALEHNRGEVFAKLLAALPASTVVAHAAALEFFERSRAMQPEKGYAWFRLLGGLSARTGGAAAAVAEPPTWELKCQTNQLAPVLTIYVRFLDAARHHMAGLKGASFRLIDPSAPATIGKPVVELGVVDGQDKSRDVDVDQLPSAWTTGPNHELEFSSHALVLWIVLLQRLPLPQRWVALSSMADWITGFERPLRDALESARLRELLADARLWATLSPAQRARILDEVAARPDRLAWRTSLVDGDLSRALNLIDRSDGFAARQWLAHCPPIVGDDALTLSVNGHERWPTPEPLTLRGDAWLEVLQPHLIAWARLDSSSPQLPPAIAQRWTEAQHWLDDGQAMALLHACSADARTGPPLRLAPLLAAARGAGSGLPGRWENTRDDTRRPFPQQLALMAACLLVQHPIDHWPRLDRLGRTDRRTLGATVRSWLDAEIGRALIVQAPAGLVVPLLRHALAALDGSEQESTRTTAVLVIERRKDAETLLSTLGWSGTTSDNGIDPTQ